MAGTLILTIFTIIRTKFNYIRLILEARFDSYYFLNDDLISIVVAASIMFLSLV